MTGTSESARIRRETEGAAIQRILDFSTAIERGEEPWREGVQEISRIALEARRALADAPAGDGESGAIRDVLAERRRQVAAEGWTVTHDDQHRSGELALAAACYALVASPQIAQAPEPPPYWPFDDEWWKSTDRRRDLVKAGALILAEIERLDRLPSPPAEKG